MGWFSAGIDSITGKSGRRGARNDIKTGARTASNSARAGFSNARNLVGRAGFDASSHIVSGSKDQRSAVRRGTERARNEISGGFDSAIGRIEEGQTSAQGRYDTNEIATSRAELLSRVQGKGGFSPEIVNSMKANAREEFGTGLRSAEQALDSYYGESGGGGLAGENLAYAASELGGQRGRATRDIDIENAKLVRSEQGNAITSLYDEAGDRSRIDTRASEQLAGLEEGRGLELASNETKEAFALAGISESQGNALASIAANVGISLADLSTEEATILANIATGKGSNLAGTRSTTNWLATAAISVLSAGAQGAAGAYVSGK